MDPLGVAASIATLLHVCRIILGYFEEVKESSSSRRRVRKDISSLYGYLVDLQCRLEERGANEDEWFKGVRTLAAKNGPLDDYRSIHEELQSRMTRSSLPGSLRKLSEAIKWPFKET
ncbi:hypothetical protein K402DRAFT_263869 [Aulographum hederae CBS 113979]|uniref:Fungal N-terminal domain-containing protein n=1 Tax=Aulographum hederae CBS 113979 TaxID=1176131 RepID=A0A6G1HA33_9PEZI|nr:hypothetical protein K402DRAFT_263869 [Aulographum hederae CBS 113979]